MRRVSNNLNQITTKDSARLANFCSNAVPGQRAVDIDAPLFGLVDAIAREAEFMNEKIVSHATLSPGRKNDDT